MFTALNHPKPPWLCHVVKPYKRTLMSKSTQVLGFLVLAPLMPSPCLLASCRFALSCTWVLHGESCEGVECHASLWDIHSPCLVASCHFASFYTWTPSSMKHQLCCPMWIHHTSTCPHQMVLWWIPTRGMSPTPIIRMWVVRTMRTLRGWNQWRHSWLFPLCQLPLFFNMKEIKGKFYSLHHLYYDFYTSSMATSKWLPLRLFTHQLHIKVPQTKVGLLLAKDANVSTNNAKLGFIVQIFFTILIHGLWIMHGVGPHLETCSCYNSMNITPFLPKWTQTWRRCLFTTSPPKVHSYWSTLPHFIHQLCPFKFLHIK